MPNDTTYFPAPFFSPSFFQDSYFNRIVSIIPIIIGGDMVSNINHRGEISFDAVNRIILNQLPFGVTNLRVYSMAPIDIARLNNLARPGSLVSDVSVREKIVSIEGMISRRGKSLYYVEQTIDDLKRDLGSGPGILKAGFTDNRYFTNARLIDELKISWPEGASRNDINWAAEFLCPDPYMYLASSEVIATGAVPGTTPTWTYSPLVPVVGTAPMYPIITVNLSTTGTATVMEFYNSSDPAASPPTIRIARTFVAGTSIVVNCANRSVQLNGVDIPFSGSFPEMRSEWNAYNVNTINVRITATTQPTGTFSVQWQPTWR